MGSPQSPRHARLHDDESDDQRSRFARDRDRVLFSGSFRRLAGVTQVAAPLATHLFHSRLTHSLEVAQVGRRIAERLLATRGARDGLTATLDPDVVEAACLIHDLGHPPFGHVAEEELDRLASMRKNTEGFEGNAQSFRIVTRLAVHRSEYDGLDLTRATLNAVLKYPWPRNHEDGSAKDHFKFGSYVEDKEAFEWARDGSHPRSLSLEAQIMDYADDVAYSVHDIVDFYRAGILPLATLCRDNDEFGDFLKAWRTDKKHPLPQEIDSNPDQYREMLSLFLVHREYTGTKDQRAALRNIATSKISEYDKAATVKEENGGFALYRDHQVDLQISFLQRVFFHYLILNPRLMTQQQGQRTIIRFLFKTYFDATRNPRAASLIPGRFRHLYEALGSSAPPSERARLAVDIVASFTDAQALSVFRRLNGNDPGEITDIIAW